MTTTKPLTAARIAALRLRALHVASNPAPAPGDVVRSLAAMQGQLYRAVLWAIGLRLAKPSLSAVEAAFDSGELVRAWPLRGTLHAVAARDLRWMVGLRRERYIATSARRREELGLDAHAFSRAHEIFARSLEPGEPLTREAMMEALRQGGVDPAGQRGIHLIAHAANDALICFGPSRGKQQTFVLVDRWIPADQHRPAREEALATLALCYFVSHGPATLRDFVWWTGQPVAECRLALGNAAPQLAAAEMDGAEYWMAPEAAEATGMSGSAWLLPPFDEYLLGYTDRTAVLASQYGERVVPGKNGMFRPIVVTGGRVVATWQPVRTKSGVEVTIDPFEALAARQQSAIDKAIARYTKAAGGRQGEA